MAARAIAGILDPRQAGAEPRPLSGPAAGAPLHALVPPGVVALGAAGAGDTSWMSGAAPLVAAGSGPGADGARAAWDRSGGDPVRFAAGLEGGVAAAVLDPAGRRLVLVRDRLGERPLYYVALPGVAAFASDLATLRRAGALSDPALLPPAVDAFLCFSYVPAPWTIFRQAKRVRAGHVVTIDLGALGEGRVEAVREAAYWTLPERGDEPATAAEMLERLQQAMERRLPRGEEAVVFLSGGLDSSLVAALAARVGRRVRTFSIGFADAAFDESERARAFARGLGAEHREILLDRIEAESFEELVDRLDEPFADAACIPTWLLAREASAAGAHVAMTGDGSDALLAGDHWFRRMRRLDRLRAMPGGLRRSLAALARLGGGRQARRFRDLAAWAGLPPAEGYLRMRERWRRAERLALYAPAFREQADPAAAEATWLDVPIAWRPGRLVEGALRLDAAHNLPEGLLMKVERMGRPHGVECRSAFLDREFVEWSARLDTRLLLRGKSGKNLLRQAASPIIPREIAFGRKHGLMVPTAGWLRGPLRGVLDEAFADALIARQGIFDAASLRGLRERFERAPDDAITAGRVWQLVVFQTWWRRALG